MKRPVIVAIVATVAVLGTGGALTKVGPWYYGLRKPSWNPPSWAFGPAWTLIGALTAWAAVVAWAPLRTRSERTTLITLFTANGVFNILWSLLFFNLRRPDWALNEVVLLWLSILALVVNTAVRTPLAALLLAPYLAWVSFAAFLNLVIVRLNPSPRTS
jgi:tryptophan-rich sensory protein